VNSEKFEEKVFTVLKDYPLDTVFLAAVSGGADSIAMLTALSVVKCKDSIFCLHVEHGLRAEESLGDAVFVREYCEKLGIKYRIVSIPPGKITAFAESKGVGIEAAARFFRHRVLSREAARLKVARLGNNTHILIAHTKDDMLETVLMRLLRGCGPAGLAMMPEKTGRIIRPLLFMNRIDVIQYLTEKKLSWREDSTNTDEKFLRNKIRRRLIPLLSEDFPSWKSGVSRMAETQSFTADFIAEEAKQNVHWTPGSSLSTDADNFFAQPLIIREEALFQGINLLGKSRVKTIKRAVIRKFCAGTVTTVDLGPERVRREGGKILLLRVEKEFFECGVSLLIS